jgi:hypothetical protein
MLCRAPPPPRSAGLASADTAPTSSDAAWALRRAFDDVLSSNALASAVLGATTAAPAGGPLSFREGLPADAGVEIMNDTIMGGGSSSSVRHDATRRALLFSGDLVAANGGFASFRCGPRAWCAAGAENAPAVGVRVVLAAADGGAARELKLTARSDDGWDGVAYQTSFTLPAGEQPTTLQLPFTAFRYAHTPLSVLLRLFFAHPRSFHLFCAHRSFPSQRHVPWA